LVIKIKLQMSGKYFDNNANCPIDDQTLAEYMKGARIGNVSCETKLAERGKKLISELKSYIACEFSGNCTYKAIITSGGSESNSTVIAHYMYTALINGLRPHFVSSAVEHPSITDYFERLERDGAATISWIKPKFNGEIAIEDINGAIQPDTVCVFLQSVNSETGCVQNIVALQGLLRNKSKTLNRNIGLHVDHVQGLRRIEYPKDVGDTIALSLHKVGAPLGIGILLTRIPITPLIAGKQNDSMRGGTYNIGAIEAGYGALKRFNYKQHKVYKQYFINTLSRHFKVIEYPKLDIRNPAPTIILFSDKKCLPHTLFFAIMVNTKVLCGLAVKRFMFSEGYTIGTGTACANEATEPLSHGSMVASDIPDAIKKGFIRISFGCDVNQQKLEKLAGKFAKLIKFI
jgi:cysteine sulfinate desulfinase/cysteine desulfurase-like protein